MKQKEAFLFLKNASFDYYAYSISRKRVAIKMQYITNTYLIFVTNATNIFV